MPAEHLARAWRILLVRGLAAIAFAWITVAQPEVVLPSFLTLFGGFSLADGALGVWAAVSNRHEDDDRHWLFLGGLAGISVGLIAMAASEVTGLLLLLLAAWAVSIGLLEIAAAMRLRREIQGEWRLGLAGLVSIAAGTAFLLRPDAGPLTFAWLVTCYAALVGVLFVALSLELRRFGQHPYRAAS